MTHGWKVSSDDAWLRSLAHLPSHSGATSLLARSSIARTTVSDRSSHSTSWGMYSVRGTVRPVSHHLTVDSETGNRAARFARDIPFASRAIRSSLPTNCFAVMRSPVNGRHTSAHSPDHALYWLIARAIGSQLTSRRPRCREPTEMQPAPLPCGTGGSAHSSPAEAVMGFVLGEAGYRLSGGVLVLGVVGPRPDACGPAAL